MPAKKKTRADRVLEVFTYLYDHGKVDLRQNEAEIARMLGYKSRDPLCDRRKDPEKFTWGEMAKLATAFRWKDEDILRLFHTTQGVAS